jgi:predicted phosphoribosyltransferase
MALVSPVVPVYTAQTVSYIDKVVLVSTSSDSSSIAQNYRQQLQLHVHY